MVKDPISVNMTGITKRFGEVKANDDVDLELKPGVIHALLGENGAGKSTLMNILSGFYQADSGLIDLNGNPQSINSPREALAAGIGMVHQHFMLIKGCTVAENIILGTREPRFYLNTASINDKIKNLSQLYQLQVDPDARIRQLSIGERQRVEILKLLYRNTRVLILDEPTSVLTSQEVDHLFGTLRHLKNAGGTIVFISHKLEEVMSISDSITVLRNGRKVATVQTGETSTSNLAKMMVGELTVPIIRSSALKTGHEAEVVLSLEGIWADSDRGLMALKNFDLRIHRGEIFGLLGVAGNGQKELAEVSTGLRKPTRGIIKVRGFDLTGSGVRRFIEAGVSYIPEDRLGVGLVGGMSVAENILLKSYRGKPYSSGLILKPATMDKAAGELIHRYSISPGDPGYKAGALSGGNIQRLILARELSGFPHLLIAAYPFQGLDVTATDFLTRTLKERSADGLAVLLIGEDLELTLGVSHRVGVIYKGCLKAVMPPDKVRLENLGMMMAGQTIEDEK